MKPCELSMNTLVRSIVARNDDFIVDQKRDGYIYFNAMKMNKYLYASILFDQRSMIFNHMQLKKKNKQKNESDFFFGLYRFRSDNGRLATGILPIFERHSHFEIE